MESIYYAQKNENTKQLKLWNGILSELKNNHFNVGSYKSLMKTAQTKVEALLCERQLLN